MNSLLQELAPFLANLCRTCVENRVATDECCHRGSAVGKTLSNTTGMTRPTPRSPVRRFESWAGPN
jgi:hypothetical protein